MEESGKHPPRNSGKSWLISEQHLHTERGNCKILSALVPHLMRIIVTYVVLHSYSTGDQQVYQ